MRVILIRLCVKQCAALPPNSTLPPDMIVRRPKATATPAAIRSGQREEERVVMAHALFLCPVFVPDKAAILQRQDAVCVI